MKIFKLRLKKFIGIQKGLGLDEITLDISGLSGLVAISGDNGNGKTTILECLHPYARLVSRKGALQYHTHGRDAEKELDFEFNGDIYKTLIKIDSESGRSEGFIWKNGKSEIDGKISNYSKYILKLMGSPELFFNSVFCGQGSKKLNDMKPADLKNLFAEFLRLEKLIAYEDTAKQCANLLDGRLGILKREIGELETQAAGHESTKAKWLKLIKHGKSLDIIHKKIVKESERIDQNLLDIQTGIQKNEVTETELQGLETSQNMLSKEIEADKKQSEAELDKLRETYQQLGLELVGIETLLANEDAIREAVTTKDELLLSIDAYREQLNTASKNYFIAYDAVAKKQVERTECSHKAMEKSKDTQAAINTLEIELEHNRLKIKDLEKRDPNCESQICSFIISALSAQEDIPKLTAKIADMVEASTKIERAYSDKLKIFDAGIESLSESSLAQKKIKADLEEKIAKANYQLAFAEKIAQDLPKLNIAIEKKQGLEKQQASNKTEGLRVKNVWGERISGKEELSTANSVAIIEKKKMIDRDVTEKYNSTKQALLDLKSSISETAEQISENTKAIVIEEKELAFQESAIEILKTKKKSLSMALNELGDWKYLKDACGKDGLRALEIDSVAPVISAYANNLLIAAFGPDATVSIKTQDDEGREILDIQVIDEDGDEVPLGSRSGGEQQWALKAMQLAMAMISNEKSGKNFQTMLSDEETGPLDNENAQKYILLYRKFMEQGDFDTCFYISHNANCVAMADHVINLGNGKIDMIANIIELIHTIDLLSDL